MMWHCLRLRMQDRMVYESLDSGSSCRRNHSPSNPNLVWTNVWTDMIDCLDVTYSLRKCRLLPHVANDCLSSTEFLDALHLIIVEN